MLEAEGPEDRHRYSVGARKSQNPRSQMIKLYFDLSLPEEEIAKQRDERNGAVREILKPILWSLQNRRCPHCGEELEPRFFWEGKSSRVPKSFPTLEHVLARHFGGKTRVDNLLLAHSKCNGLKGNAPPSAEELVMLKTVTEYIRNRPALWPLLPYLVPKDWVKSY